MLETIVAIYAQTMERHGSRKAQTAKINGTWKSWTWAQVDHKVRSLSAALVELGIQPGERVALLSENRPEWVWTDLAILMTGAVNVPIYPTLTAKQLAFILNDCQAKVAFASTSAQLAKLKEAAAEVPSLELLVHFDSKETAGSFEGARSLDELLALGEDRLTPHEAELRQRREAIRPDTLSSIIYTSGTTGNPKGVMLSHKNFASNATTVADLVDIQTEDSCLSFLPLSHVLERVAYYVFLFRGAHINYAESIDTVAQNLTEVTPTFLVSVPRLFEKIRARVIDTMAETGGVKKALFEWGLRVGGEFHALKAQGKEPGPMLGLEYKLADRLVFSKVRARTGGRLKFCISGGAPLSKEVGLFFKIIGITILEGYGLTETSPVISCNQPKFNKIGTVGLTIPQVEVRIAEDGEILARGPNIMLGYYNNPQATQETIDADGWLHTGDIGKIDSDGFLAITDRKKEILVLSNGKNVAPAPIENSLITSSVIAQAVLVGDNRNYVTALICPNFESLGRFAKEHGIAGNPSDWIADAKVKELFRSEIDRLTTDYARFEQIKEFVLLREELSQDKDELTPTLKYKRRVILANYASQIEAMYGGAPVKA
ncbi:Long-chain-fatty-acid--CoA ligase FadD15 [compost metagenome]